VWNTRLPSRTGNRVPLIGLEELSKNSPGEIKLKFCLRRKLVVWLTVFAFSIGNLVPANPALASDPIDSCAYNGQQHLEVFLNVDSPEYPVSATTVGGNIAWFQSQASGQEPNGGNLSADPTVGYGFNWEEMRAGSQLIYSIYASGVFGSGPTGDPLCTMTINYSPAPQTSITSCTIDGQTNQTINVPEGTPSRELMFSGSGGNSSFFEVLADGEKVLEVLETAASLNLGIPEWISEFAGSTRRLQYRSVNLGSDPPQATGPVLCSIDVVYAATSSGSRDAFTQLASSNYFVAEGFERRKHRLSSAMKSFISEQLKARAGEKRVVCTGTVRGRAWNPKREALALARAKAGCDYVRTLLPDVPVELKKRLISKPKGNPLTVRIRAFY
jgi:hypothetical protein